jgi:acetyl esterase/lipase
MLMSFARHISLLCLCCLLGCSRFQLLNAMIPSGDYHRDANIAYGAEPRQNLDVYRPKKGGPTKRIVVFFYGGYWQYGKKEDYRFVGEALTSEDFIAVLPDYRLYPSVQFPAFVRDGALAVRWVHDHAGELGGDPDQIYLMGHSAGAYIAAMLTLDARYLKAVGLDRSNIRATVGLAGPYDFKIGKELRPIFAQPTTGPVDPVVEPITFVDGREPPMLLIQGAQDTTVEPGNATRLAEKIRDLGGQAQLIIFQHLGHSALALALAAPFRWIAPVLKDSAAFFRKQ